MNGTSHSPSPTCLGVNTDIVGDGNPHSFDCEGHSWKLMDYGDVLYIEHAEHEWDAELTRDADGAWRFGIGAIEHIAKHSADTTPAALEAYVAKHHRALSPKSLSRPATFARYLDVLEAEYDQSVMELQSATEAMDIANHEADSGDHSRVNVAFDAQERAGHLRNVAWTMLVQARALLGVSS